MNGYKLSWDGEHLDLWSQVEQLIASRSEPFAISWIKGHASQEHVDIGISSPLGLKCNAAADKLAVAGAAQHSCSAGMDQLMQQHIRQSVDLGLMYTEIACVRKDVAKKHCLLTYAKAKKTDESQPDESNVGFCHSFFHTDVGQPLENNF